ncbi:zinc finger CCCH domain-containing protein 18-like [Biomphalaria glabrata]|uniref:Zinc finger CCCH domain-containing protein 18-like n=1 Tax=Biomphalaria glabrata TaxID=6526 RepID=A0A9W3B3L8_BIOGL|nr:zinc finger CCCH domain-containing protein 18-like [Biomphalaria glabrata]
MASGTRSKADSDMKQKIAELRELAAVMYDDEAKQKEYVRAEFEKEREESRKEKEREHEIAMEREKREAEVAVAIAIAKEKEITEREREKQITERERITAEKENGTASQASSGSRPASPASQQRAASRYTSRIASAADRYATARKDVKDTKSKTSASDKPEDQPTSSNKHAPSSQPAPFAKPQHQKAPIQRPATPTSYDRRSHPPRHGQTNNHHRDRNSTSDHRPNRQQQAPRTVSAMTELPEPSLHNQPSPLDEEEEDYYVISALTVAPEPTACGLTQPIPPHPTISPPGVETILINGSPVQALFDSGCEVSSVISKALVDPSDLTGGSVTVQSLDRGIPPKAYPVARVHVECKYVHGTIDAVVMDSPVYDFVLGSRYIPLGVVNKPYFSLPVAIKPLMPGTDPARKSQRKVNFHSRESGPHHGSTQTLRPLFPDIDRVWKIRGYTRLKT